MHVGVYTRLSKNRGGLSDNCEIQEAEEREYADDNDWLVVFIGKDDDRSASKFSTKPRPDYERLMRAVAANEIEVVIVTEMTRLYRRIEELLDLFKLSETTRLRRIETTDGTAYNLDTPEGRHAAVAVVNNAVLESAKLSKRIKRKKAARARNGLPSGGGRPFGFEQDGITLRESEVKLLIEAKDRYIGGTTMRDIVRDFGKRGVLSPYDKPWMIENFQRVLFSKRYLGIRVHNGAEYPAQWPAIFKQTDWDLMNARRIERAAKYPGRRKGTSRQYLLTGLIFCGRCGTGMVGSRRKMGDTYQRRYRCRTMDNYGKPLGCGKTFRNADVLELWVTEAVFYRFDTPAVAQALAQVEDDTDLDTLVAEYQAAKLKLDQMVRDYASGFLTRDQFGIAKTVAEDDLAHARDALAKAQRTDAPDVPPSSAALREAWKKAGTDWKHSVIKLLVEKVVCLADVGNRSHTWRGFHFDSAAVDIVWRH